MMVRSLKNQRGGFSLIEVLIGVMVLGVAIVAATSILVGLLSLNKTNAERMQAYYLAQEGLEAVRNIRDSDWLNGFDFNEQDGLFPAFEIGEKYTVGLKAEGWLNSRATTFSGQAEIQTLLPWDFEKIDTEDNFDRRFLVGVENAENFMRLEDEGKYYRHLEFEDLCESEEYVEYEIRGECDEIILVKSLIDWKDGAKEKHLELSTILTNWKK